MVCSQENVFTLEPKTLQKRRKRLYKNINLASINLSMISYFILKSSSTPLLQQ